MSLPELPPLPEQQLPVIQVVNNGGVSNPPVVLVPSTSGTGVLSTSANDLTTNTQNNNNRSNSNASVQNTNVNVSEMKAPYTSVGDISYQSAHFFMNGYVSGNGNDVGGVIGLQVPLGGGGIRKAASKIASLRVEQTQQALESKDLSTCAAINNSNLTAEAVESINPRFVKCVKTLTATAQVEHDDRDQQIVELKAQVLEMRQQFDASRASRVAPPVQALW